MRDRLTAESAEEREARLQRMSTLQHARLAVETDEEREDRLQRAREQSSQVLLFEQHSIQVKMRRFHAHFALLNPSRCSTCLESFPGLQLRPPSTECVHCYPDKHAPKMYSSANNIDPGPLPTQLQVGTCICMQIPCSPVMRVACEYCVFMSLYRLPHGQYAYSGHVINLPQDVTSFANSLIVMTAQ